MALIDLAARRVRVRVVYYGPAFGGKTTSLRQIAERVPNDARGDLLSLADEDDRTLFLDHLPLDLGEVGGWHILVDLTTVPGQPQFERTRIAVLQGADGVVFVADSDPARQDANAESLAELERHLIAAGHEPARFPLVVQANKRDLPGAVAVDALPDLDGGSASSVVPSVAVTGDGVFEALRAICKLVAASL